MTFHTEEEAKKKICPHMRYIANETAVVQDGHNPIYYQSQCLGSACMAWEALPQMWRHKNMTGDGTWDDPKEVDGYGRKGTPLPIRGRCGLSRGRKK